MTIRQVEETRAHTRLLKCGLETEDTQIYWSRIDPVRPGAAVREAFEDCWFGARTMPRTDLLLTSLRARFEAFPRALSVLHAWPEMDPDTRRLICHWHLQMSDPLYRKFTGEGLVGRRKGSIPEVTHSFAVAWISEHGPARWGISTRIQFASKLLHAAWAAGLVARDRDPRPLTCPQVDERALTYLLYLLREVDFQGNLLANPYLASVGLEGELLMEHLRELSSLVFRRQGDRVDFGWRYSDLLAWARATVTAPLSTHIGAPL